MIYDKAKGGWPPYSDIIIPLYYEQRRRQQHAQPNQRLEIKYFNRLKFTTSIHIPETRSLAMHTYLIRDRLLCYQNTSVALVNISLLLGNNNVYIAFVDGKRRCSLLI